MVATLAPIQHKATKRYVKRAVPNLKIAQTNHHPVSNESSDSAFTLPSLPTFSWEVGYRLVTDPQTGEQREVQLTLLDFLDPCEEDMGVVFMAQSPLHDRLVRVLAVMLQAYLSASEWLILHDVFVRWGRRGTRPKAPDIAAIRGGRLPAKRHLSYEVGRDGPLPEFVVEITSEETRSIDLTAKQLTYAAIGVKEYLIIDLLPETGEDWQLLGYRLGENPFYTKLTPDAAGGLSFETIGLRFVAVDSQQIDIYDLATGERLLTPEEANARVKAETMARAELEAQLRALEEKVRQAGLQL